ncbi:C6 zinc finger domain protein, partial [Aspergillus lentulus]
MEYTQDVSPDILPSPLFRYPSNHLTGEGLLATGATPTPLIHNVPKAPSPQLRMDRLKRPHTKSRRGCFNCKTRRVKCQETKPACLNCLRRDQDCVYPGKEDGRWPLVKAGQKQHLIPRLSPAPSASPRIGTAPFTSDDLRFWHHFLADARPGLPLGDEGTWSSEIPAFAHDCPHLLHALLSLGASYCCLTTSQRYKYAPLAIAHRGKALKALGAILAKGDDCTMTEMDSALATCYALTFQARQMSDGVIDFAVMVRGCSIITNWYVRQSRKSNIFNCLQSQEQMMQTTTLPWEPQTLKDADTIAACIAALDRLQPLLETRTHWTFYNTLRLSYESLLISYRHAFIQLTMIYVTWSCMDSSEFHRFIASANHISRALFMHYITIDSFMRPVYAKLNLAKNRKSSGGHFLIYRWAEDIYEGLPESIQGLVYDQFQYLALDLIPDIAVHRAYFPQWNHELA